MKTISVPFGVSQILQHDLDSPVVTSFVAEHQGRISADADKKVGQILFDNQGYDVVLDYAEGRFFVHHARFFSPEYCTGKAILPFGDELIESLQFPLKRQEVRERLGTPDREVDNARHLDEYDFANCTVQFVYRANCDAVVFLVVQVPHSDKDMTWVRMTVEQRTLQIDGTARSKWLERYDVYKKIHGPAQSVLRYSNPSVPVSLDVLVFKIADYCTLLTSGMSDQPIPNAMDGEKRVELEMHVSQVNKDYYSRLVQDAAFPFVDRCTLGHGDTIAWNMPIANQSKLTEELFIYSPYRSHREMDFWIGDEKLTLLCCMPITLEELGYKKRHGIDKLLAAFDAAKLSCVVNPKRDSIVP